MMGSVYDKDHMSALRIKKLSYLTTANISFTSILLFLSLSLLFLFSHFHEFVVFNFYSGRRRRVLKWARNFFFVLVLPILHFGR